jgi:glutamate-1-semialdehyde 2,1-aminomutase
MNGGSGRSEELFARARRVSPGGVHSPVRAFRGVGGTPRFMTGGAGALLRDVDGRDYVDYCMAFGPLIFGHADPAIRSAAEAALARGWSLGTAEPYSLDLAELITSRVPWVESIRFVNSGTEAVMSALRVARAATQRSKILKFEGCYHGHTDSMLLRAGSGLAEAPVPDSAGLAPDVVQETLVTVLDDERAAEAMFAQAGGEIAAVIIEPLPANYGLLPQRAEYLRTLARLAKSHGALLIFDEVITGFRVGFGGYAAFSGITPDLVTYGKVIGGGFPVGAYGGRRELMELVAPAGPVYQAGTLSANPLALASRRCSASLTRASTRGWSDWARAWSRRCAMSRMWPSSASAQSSGCVIPGRNSLAHRCEPCPHFPPIAARASRRCFTRCSIAASIWRRAPLRWASFPLRTPSRTLMPSPPQCVSAARPELAARCAVRRAPTTPRLPSVPARCAGPTDVSVDRPVRRVRAVRHC